MRRRGIARDANLDDSYDVGTYPQKSTEITKIVAPRLGIVKTLLGAAVLAAGGYGAYQLLNHAKDWFGDTKQITIDAPDTDIIPGVIDWIEP